MKLNEHVLLKDIATEVAVHLQPAIGMRFGYDRDTQAISTILRSHIESLVESYGLEFSGWSICIPHEIHRELGFDMYYKKVMVVDVQYRSDKRFKYGGAGTIIDITVRPARNLRAETLGEYVDRIKVLAAARSFRHHKQWMRKAKRQYDKSKVDTVKSYEKYIKLKELI